jgi:hypothetical protein
LPYKSKAEQEAERWMTLPQAIKHIRAADHIDEKPARRELLKALADDVFRSRFLFLVRWQNEIRISGEATPSEIGPPDVPPRGKEWAQAKIRWASGKVLDPFGAVVNGQRRPVWRTVLLYRPKVVELWPASLPPKVSATSEPNGTKVVPFRGRKKGPKTKKGVSIKEAIKTDLNEQRVTKEALGEMPDKELIAKYGAKVKAGRTTCREARDAVLAELDGNSNAVD